MREGASGISASPSCSPISCHLLPDRLFTQALGSRLWCQSFTSQENKVCREIIVDLT